MRSDLKRHQVVSVPADSQRDNPQEDHNRPVHGTQLIVKLRRHYAAREKRVSKNAANNGERLVRKRQLPPHQEHHAKAEQQEEHGSDRVLKTDHFMIGGKNILSPETHFVGSCVPPVAVIVV